MSNLMRCRTNSYLLLLVLSIFLASCSKPEKPAATEASQKTFASPEDAGKALMEAAKSQNQETMLAIFGPGSKEVIYSGDTAQDKASFEGFVTAYDVMHRWRKLDDGSQVLLGWR